jgi:hypothetical protein
MQKHLTPTDRLDILRAGDSRRKWLSLDDRRICTRCNKFIAGRRVEIQRDQRGRFLLHCPTPDCESTVEDWFYVGSAANREKTAVTGASEFSFAFGGLGRLVHKIPILGEAKRVFELAAITVGRRSRAIQSIDRGRRPFST